MDKSELCNTVYTGIIIQWYIYTKQSQINERIQ